MRTHHANFTNRFDNMAASEIQMQHSGFKNRVPPDFGMLNRLMNSVFRKSTEFQSLHYYQHQVFGILLYRGFYRKTLNSGMHCFIDPNPLDLTERPVLEQKLKGSRCVLIFV